MNKSIPSQWDWFISIKNCSQLVYIYNKTLNFKWPRVANEFLSIHSISLLLAGYVGVLYMLFKISVFLFSNEPSSMDYLIVSETTMLSLIVYFSFSKFPHSRKKSPCQLRCYNRRQLPRVRIFLRRENLSIISGDIDDVTKRLQMSALPSIYKHYN